MDLIDIYIYRIFHPKSTEYTLFSDTHRTFHKTDHILRHKTSLNTFKKTEIVSSIFLDHSGMKLEINYNKKKKQWKTFKHMEAK